MFLMSAKNVFPGFKGDILTRESGCIEGSLLFMKKIFGNWQNLPHRNIFLILFK